MQKRGCFRVLSFSVWVLIYWEQMLEQLFNWKCCKAAKFFMFFNGKVRFRSVQVKNKKTILCTNHLGWKEDSLATETPWSFPGKAAINFPQRNLRPPQNYYLFWISHLVGESSFKCRTEYFLSHVIGEMFRTNELFVDSVDLAFVYLFLVRNDLSRHLGQCSGSCKRRKKRKMHL